VEGRPEAAGTRGRRRFFLSSSFFFIQAPVRGVGFLSSVRVHPPRPLPGLKKSLRFPHHGFPVRLRLPSHPLATFRRPLSGPRNGPAKIAHRVQRHPDQSASPTKTEGHFPPPSGVFEHPRHSSYPKSKKSKIQNSFSVDHIVVPRIHSRPRLPPPARKTLYPKHLGRPATLQAINPRPGIPRREARIRKDGLLVRRPRGRGLPSDHVVAPPGMAFLAKRQTRPSARALNAEKRPPRDGIPDEQRPGRSASSPARRRSRAGRCTAHGFSLLFPRLGGTAWEKRRPRPPSGLKKIIVKRPSSSRRAGQSNLGGWTYTPGGGERGPR